MAIVTEEQNWTFSLREVARRAGVSHNAPFNHFPEKRHLLDAVAATGFDALTEHMRVTAEEVKGASRELAAIMQAYTAFALGNPARYRLMFGSELLPDSGFQPTLTEVAGAGAKAVLRDVVVRGAASGDFAVDEEDPDQVAGAVLSVWSAVHGLALLLMDAKIVSPGAPQGQVDTVSEVLLAGLRTR